MPLFDPADLTFAKALSTIVYANPFLPERIEAERAALGSAFEDEGARWNIHAGGDRAAPNFERIIERAAKLLDEVRGRFDSGPNASESELLFYEDLALFHLYHAHRGAFLEMYEQAPSKKVRVYEKFRERYAHYLEIPGVTLPAAHRPEHVFAIFFNLRRAFHHIFTHIVGRSAAISNLRAEIWQSIFTHDVRRYERVMYTRMADITTLITGPSGTGKELVARAIGQSGYVPFDPDSLTFRHDFRECFFPLNLSALSSTLIESELFGHRRGSFTGATEDHVGWFEVCPPGGTVFLDEIGETDGPIQVKLLRVLQERVFQRLGDTATLRFEGKVIAATNRDLAREMSDGRFREDLYYRLCSDIITTRSLREQLEDSPDELAGLVRFIAHREVGPESDALTDEVLTVIAENLGPTYAWPGNFRELEQCVRNVLVRRHYRPTPSRSGSDIAGALADAVVAGSLSAEELTRRYITWVHSKTHNYEETARRLSIDRRTVKAKIDPELLERLDRNG